MEIVWIIVALVFLLVVVPIAAYMCSYMVSKGFFSAITKYLNKPKVNQNGKEKD